MNSKQYKELLEFYNKIYEQPDGSRIGVTTKDPDKTLQQMIDRQKLGGKVISSKPKLQKSHYELEGNEINEDHFKVGDEVTCKASGMEGEVIKVDSEEKGKYYTVKREDGKTMKYAPSELKMEKDNEKEEEGASKENETKFHKKLDKLVHKTFGERPEEKKMQEEFDNFDIILEYLVAEGYADTNQAALVIMANMSEEWRHSIVEAPGEWFGGLRDRARASRAAQMQSSQSTPKPGPNVSSPFAKPASHTDSGRLTTYGAGGGAAAERRGQTRDQVMKQGAKNLETRNKSNPGPNFGR